MPQVTIYINNELEKRIKTMASTLDISLSKLISGVLEQKLNNQWSPSVKQLAGSWDNYQTSTNLSGWRQLTCPILT